MMPKMPIPFGDDVVAFDIGEGKLAILKTDMLVAKTDVPEGMSLWQAARKAVVMNVSDFAAKGVQPQAVLVSLGLPKGFREKDIEEIGNGLNAGAREYGAYILGGDTAEASDFLISLFVFGIGEKSKVILRSGAKPGDIVAVTGCFGKTAAGLKILLSHSHASGKIREELVNSVLMPQARLKEGLLLSRSGAVSAAIDSSDGLAWSLHEIAKASGVGFVISHVPVAEEAEAFAKANRLDPLHLALYGGEEYELVLTLKPTLWRRAEAMVKQAGGELLQIGKTVSEQQITMLFKGKRRVIKPIGYEHFRNT
ncbi:thiamine-phosphate kinase [Candidatus Bathyarchaeota archaeon]|nr:thiamine-phosphate kinase [Candidatus Bathyarchaeota archaeon]